MISKLISFLSNRTWAIGSCILLTLLILFPTLLNGWVNWDDPVFVQNNAVIQEFSLENIKKLFSEKVSGSYIPLVELSWMIDTSIWKSNALGFHITNMVIHLINVVLVFLLTDKLFKNIWVSIITAILFGIHPLHIETVAWVTARKDLLYTTFFLIGLIFYYRYFKSGKSIKFFYITTFFFVLSLFSKGTAVVFPLILFVFDYLFQRKDLRKMILEKTPLLLLSAVFVYIGITGQSESNSITSLEKFEFYETIFVGFYGYFTYLIKSVIPYQVCAYNPYPMGLGESNPWYFYIMAVAILLLVGILIHKRKKWLVWCFGFTFFFIALIPVIQVLPVGTAITSDRFTYLPYLGLFWVIATGVISLYERYSKNKKLIVALTISYLVFLGVFSFEQSKTWKNSYTLWTKVIKEFPDDFLAYANRALYFIEKKQYDEALSDYSQAIKLKPRLFDLRYNRGFLHDQLGETDKALDEYNISIELNPTYPRSRLNRGILLMKKGSVAEALSDFNAAVELAPNAVKGYENRFRSLKQQGNYSKALEDVNKLIELRHDESSYYFERSKIFRKLGKYNNAFDDIKVALSIKENEIYYAEIGHLYLDVGRLEDALDAYDRTLELNSNNIDALINKGLVLLNSDKYQEAIEILNKAQSIAPNNELIYLNRGLTYKLMGNTVKAIEDFDKTLNLNPSNSLAIKELSKVQNEL